MAISKTVALANPIYDASGVLLNAAYWKITLLQANPILQTCTLVYSAYASAASFAASPTQQPLQTQIVCFPDAVNAPSATWPFGPATLVANYPGNPAAMLLAADAYALSMPFFSGGSEVS